MRRLLTGSEDGLVAYWDLDEGAGQIAGDTAHDQDGRLGSTTGGDAQDPMWMGTGSCTAGQGPVLVACEAAPPGQPCITTNVGDFDDGTFDHISFDRADERRPPVPILTPPVTASCPWAVRLSHRCGLHTSWQSLAVLKYNVQCRSSHSCLRENLSGTEPCRPSP